MSTNNAPAAVPVIDSFARPLGSLRISVTDRCNMRCRYCMPEEEYGTCKTGNFLAMYKWRANINGSD